MKKILTLSLIQIGWAILVFVVLWQLGWLDAESMYPDRSLESDDVPWWAFVLVMFFVSGPRWISDSMGSSELAKLKSENPEKPTAQIRKELAAGTPKWRLLIDRGFELVLFAAVPQVLFFLTDQRLCGSVAEFFQDAFPFVALYLLVLVPIYILGEVWERRTETQDP